MPKAPDSSKTPIKCLLLGLDNGGKTSILYTLRNKFSYIIKLKPTKQIERTDFFVLGLPFKIWDMGGQKKYRKEYLARKEYFLGTEIVIYVIDITDQSKFAESLEYFEKILDIFELINTDPRILVFFHKNDPDIKEQPQILKNKRSLKTQIQQFPHALDIAIYETSILNADHLTNLIVQELLNLIPSGRKVHEALSQFMLDINANAITLIDEHLLTIANVYREKDSGLIVQMCGQAIATLVENLREG
ncbi:MAG: ADP-ribosylation factor-like protein, partial [Candidatus Helarchaeota archaeon]